MSGGEEIRVLVMIDLTDDINKPIDSLEKRIYLHGGKNQNGSEQFRLTLPAGFVQALGWKRGDSLRLTLVLGSGSLVVEKEVS